jgi:hypothetical protein
MNEEFFTNVACAKCGALVSTKYVSSKDVKINNYCGNCAPEAYREAVSGGPVDSTPAPR